MVRVKLVLPAKGKKILLHSCCAPCSGEVMEAIMASGIEFSKDESFYMQEYCGCAYSLRDTNKWRMENGREKIRLGENYYGA